MTLYDLPLWLVVLIFVLLLVYFYFMFRSSRNPRKQNRGFEDIAELLSGQEYVRTSKRERASP